MNRAITNTGNLDHYTPDSRVTLCGNAVASGGMGGRLCKRCEKIYAKRTAYHDRTHYNARVAESQDGDMSQAPQVVAGKWDAVLRTTTRAGFNMVADDVDSHADAERESYETYARWAVGPVMTREEYAAKGEAIKAQQTAGTLSTNPYAWGMDMDVVRANLHHVESECTPMDVKATTMAGERITYAHIPNGDPDRVSLFIVEARKSGVFTDIKAEPYVPENVISDAMVEVSTDDAPYGAWNASLTDRETEERALYHLDAFELSTGRTAADGYDFPVTVTRKADMCGEGHPIGGCADCAPLVEPMPTLGKITPDMAGTWLDGAYGWHNTYRVVDLAVGYGFEIDPEYSAALDRFRVEGHGACMNDWDAAHDMADWATFHLNELAPEGYLFVWDRGEFSLVTESDAEFS